jgi:hypothetical protein
MIILMNMDKLWGAQKVWKCVEMTYNCSVYFSCSTEHFQLAVLS